jgi:hypothetical protein
MLSAVNGNTSTLPVPYQYLRTAQCSYPTTVLTLVRAQLLAAAQTNH